MLAHAIADLPPRCRAVMSLIVFDGLTHPEVAERLGIVAAVEKQAARGRRLLLQSLQPVVSDTRAEVSSTVDGGGRDV